MKCGERIRKCRYFFKSVFEPLCHSKQEDTGRVNIFEKYSKHKIENIQNTHKNKNKNHKTKSWNHKKKNRGTKKKQSTRKEILIWQ